MLYQRANFRWILLATTLCAGCGEGKPPPVGQTSTERMQNLARHMAKDPQASEQMKGFVGNIEQDAKNESDLHDMMAGTK